MTVFKRTNPPVLYLDHVLNRNRNDKSINWDPLSHWAVFIWFVNVLFIVSFATSCLQGTKVNPRWFAPAYYGGGGGGKLEKVFLWSSGKGSGKCRVTQVTMGRLNLVKLRFLNITKFNIFFSMEHIYYGQFYHETATRIQIFTE